MNTTIFKIAIIIVLCTLVSCGIKTYTRDTNDIGVFLYDMHISMLHKETGNYDYPTIKSKYSVVKGKLNGAFLLSYAPRKLDDNLNFYRGEMDTLFYANFENNTLKEGYIVNSPNNWSSETSDYYRFLYSYLDYEIRIKGERVDLRSFNYEGKGMLNANGKKEDFWVESDGWGQKSKGCYKNGIKDGYWDETIGHTRGIGYYVNGKKEGYWIEDGRVCTSKGYYEKGKREGLWLLEFPSEGHYKKPYEKDGVLVIEFVPPAEGEKDIIKAYYKNDVEIKENE